MVNHCLRTATFLTEATDVTKIICLEVFTPNMKYKTIKVLLCYSVTDII